MTTNQNTSESVSSVEGTTATDTVSMPSKPQGTTLEELLARVKVFRQSVLANPGEVKNGKPNKSYCWVSIDPRRRAAFEALGYSVCKDKDVVTSPLWKREDGTHVRGDLILYEVPREQQEIITFSEQLDALERVDGAKETFRQLARANRLAVLEEDK